MQVYVHLAGKNHGPYSIDQLRQYVQAGNFRDDLLVHVTTKTGGISGISTYDTIGYAIYRNTYSVVGWKLVFITLSSASIAKKSPNKRPAVVKLDRANFFKFKRVKSTT